MYKCSICKNIFKHSKTKYSMLKFTLFILIKSYKLRSHNQIYYNGTLYSSCPPQPRIQWVKHLSIVLFYLPRNDMINLHNCMEERIQTQVIHMNRNLSLYCYRFSDIYSRRAWRYLTYLLSNALFRAAMQIDHVIPRSK